MGRVVMCVCLGGGEEKESVLLPGPASVCNVYSGCAVWFFMPRNGNCGMDGTHFVKSRRLSLADEFGSVWLARGMMQSCSDFAMKANVRPDGFEKVP